MVKPKAVCCKSHIENTLIAQMLRR